MKQDRLAAKDDSKRDKVSTVLSKNRKLEREAFRPFAVFLNEQLGVLLSQAAIHNPSDKKR